MSELWAYLAGNRGQIGGWALTTLWLAALPVVAGLVLAVPVGVLAAANRWTRSTLVGLTGVLYTIPSLVLFLVLPGILHTKILAPVNVAVALTVYTFALLVRTVVDGLSAVPADVLDVAAAMGQTRWQRLVRVRLPIAVPVLAAGLRVAAVSNVSLVSVASVIGTAQLGQLFVVGDNLGAPAPIVLGLIGFVVLALVFDAVIVLAGRLATPWQRGRQRGSRP